MISIYSTLDTRDVRKALRNATKSLITVSKATYGSGYLDSLYILNSNERSNEENVASLSLPRCETFGLCATVISTAFPRLAPSPGPEGKVWNRHWPLETQCS